MPDPASLTAPQAPPGSAPTSPLPVTPVGRARHYQVREVLWGNHKRFLVRDTANHHHRHSHHPPDRRQRPHKAQHGRPGPPRPWERFPACTGRVAL